MAEKKPPGGKKRGRPPPRGKGRDVRMQAYWQGKVSEGGEESEEEVKDFVHGALRMGTGWLTGNGGCSAPTKNQRRK